MKLEFNWAYSSLTKAQQATAEKKATKWAEENLPNGEYVIADDATAYACARDYITESLWAFKASFLAGETGLNERCFAPIQDSLQDDANPAFRAMIDGTCGIDRFVTRAIFADGRGHFISMYDGYEHELPEIRVNRQRVRLYAYRNN